MPYTIHPCELSEIIEERDPRALRDALQETTILPFDYPPLSGMSPLCTAVTQGSEEMTRILLAHGVNPNERCYGELTPLYAAAIRLDYKLMRILEEAGAKRELSTRTGTTIEALLARTIAWRNAGPRARQYTYTK